MKHFVIIGFILLFCFGVLPEFVINNSYGGIESTARQVQIEYEKNKSSSVNLPPPEEFVKVDDIENDLLVKTSSEDTIQDDNEEENDDEIKIKTWLKKSEEKVNEDKANADS